MSLNYQVVARFKFSGSRGVLAGAEISTTLAPRCAIPLPASWAGGQATLHIFSSLQEARSFVAWLFSVRGLPVPPLAVRGQQDLFSEH